MKSGNTPQDEPQIDRDGFVFYTSWLKGIKGFSPEIQGEICLALLKYCAFGKVQKNMKPAVRLAFDFAKPQIDANNAKYLNGLKGGAPKGNKNALKTTQNNLKTTKNNQRLILQNNQKQPKNNLKQPNVKEKEKEKEKDKDKVKVKDKEKDNNILTVINNSSSITKLTQQKPAFDFMEFFNSVMKRSNAQIPQIKSLSGNREKFINARIREYGLDAVKEVVEKAAASDFLNGGGENGWRADCTWILRPNNFPKILEGNFDNHPQQINTITYGGSNYKQRSKQAIIDSQKLGIQQIFEEADREWERRQRRHDAEVVDISADTND